MTAYATANGQGITRASISIGASGPWFADLEFEGEAPQVVGPVTVQIDKLKLVGTVDPDRNGVFGSAKKCRVVGGAGGWSNLLKAQHYHNDAGVKALNVAADAARAAGEALGTFNPESLRVGIDYVRQSGPASRALEDVIGAASWWVDYAGVTQVGTRPTTTPAEADYDVVKFDPSEKRLTLGVQDITVIGVGSVITKTLDAPQTVRDLFIELDAGELVIKAWCGVSAPQSRLASLMRRIVERSTDGQLFGSYRYRVVKMSGDRVELQAVRKAAGVPDLVPVSMWPGIAGAHASLTPGAEVLVTFIEGDRSMPIVTHFAGKDGTGFAPISMLLEVATFLDLGGAGGAPVALATLVQTAITTAVLGHTHAVPALGTSANGVLLAPVGPVAALKVRAL